MSTTTATPLSPTELHRTFTTMRAHGGGFVSRLAEAWLHGDSINRERLASAFPDLLRKFGPGSPFYSQISS
jgi:hypothetical protein